MCNYTECLVALSKQKKKRQPVIKNVTIDLDLPNFFTQHKSYLKNIVHLITLMWDMTFET